MNKIYTCVAITKKSKNYYRDFLWNSLCKNKNPISIQILWKVQLVWLNFFKLYAFSSAIFGHIGPQWAIVQNLSDQLLHFALFICYTGQQLVIFDHQQTEFEKHKWNVISFTYCCNITFSKCRLIWQSWSLHILRELSKVGQSFN